MAYLQLDFEDEIHNVEWEERIKGDVAYNINDDTVAVIRESKQEQFVREADWMDAFKPYLALLTQTESDKEKEADRKYKVQATLWLFDEYINAFSDSDAQDIIDNLESRINAKVEEFKNDEQTYKSVCSKKHSIKNGDVKEVFWVKGQRMVRVRNSMVNGLTIWYPRKEVELQLQRESQQQIEQNNSSPSKIAREAEIKIFEKKFWEADGGLIASVEDFNKTCNVGFFNDNKKLDSSLGAQFLRYSTESSAGANLNWADERKITIGAKSEGSFSLAECQGSFSIQLPNEDGLGIMQLLKREAPSFMDDDYTEVFFKVSLTTTGSAFVGACASVSVDMGLSLSSKEAEDSQLASARINRQEENDAEIFAGASGGVDLFVGGKAQAEVKFSMDTMFVEDAKLDVVRAKTKTVGERGDAVISSKDCGVKWETLGEATIGAFAAWGYGISACFKLGYTDGVFGYQMKAGIVVEGGAGLFIKGAVNPILIGKFILTVANGMNWKNISDVFDKTAQIMYHTVMNNCFYLGKKVEEVYGEIYQSVQGKFLDFLDFLTEMEHFVAKGFGELKIADDRLDEIVPGYSSFKQYSMTFLVLKQTFHFFEEIEHKNRAIIAVQQAKNDPLRWHYATWQMKVNLIYDMRSGFSDNFDSYTNEERGEAVLAVLETARYNEEFYKIMSGLYNHNGNMDREKVKVEDLLIREQNDELKLLKVKFNYVDLY